MRWANVGAWLGVGACVIGLWAHQELIIGETLIDDAYISFRYAQNLAAGEGLVFNPGERVEGYTNFLWVLLLAGAALFGASLPWFAVALSQLLGAACVVLAFCLGESLSPKEHPLLRLFAPVLVAASGVMATWSGSGMETMLFTAALLLGAWGLACGGPAMVAAGSLLAALTRPEGAVIMLAMLALAWLASRQEGAATSRVALILATPLVLYGAYFLWRWSYFGAFLPNTYHAKTGGGLAQVANGLRYGWRFALDYGLALAWAGPLWLVAAPRLGLRMAAVGVAVPAVLLSGAAMAVGGDWMPYYRFFAPVWPFAAVLFQEALAASLGPSAARRPGVSWLALGLLLAGAGGVCLLPSLSGRERRSLKLEVALARDRIQIGHWLREFAQPGDSVAVSAIGIVPHISGLRTYDPLGLIDPEVAGRATSEGDFMPGHAKVSYERILQERPTFILTFASLAPTPPSRDILEAGLLREDRGRLGSLPAFRERYLFQTARIGEQYLSYYVLRDSERRKVIFMDQPRFEGRLEPQMNTDEHREESGTGEGQRAP